MSILNRIYIAVSWQLLLNSTTPPSGAGSSSNGTSFNGTILSLNFRTPKTNSTTNSTQAGSSNADFANLWSQIAVKVMSSS
jgi:hypothetical protein